MKWSGGNIKNIVEKNCVLFNRPGVAGAVLQTALSFIHSVIH